ncbi:MAG TPA: SH3 domain-containing protein [Rudaea sp.]|uniref:SH3 domain-containing protein n=1 Tax=Rudaea sp. TaxID=2136325 RepID=UPI002F93EA8F
MKRLMSYAIASAFLITAPALALADEGYVTGTMNLRAGPDVSYPIVDTIPAGEPVSVQGCTEDYEWCDVIWGEERGWIAGNYIEYGYNDQPVLLSGYGAAIGIPIVTFVIADYWGRYYHNRPFWGQRERWYNRPYQHHAPPRAFSGPLHDYRREGGHSRQEFRGREQVRGNVRDAPHASSGYAPHAEHHGAPAQYHNNAPAQYHNNNAPAQYHNNNAPQYHNNNAAQYHNNAPVNQGQVNHGPANHAPANHAPANHAQVNQAPANGHGQAPAAHNQGQGHHDDNKHDDHGH